MKKFEITIDIGCIRKKAAEPCDKSCTCTLTYIHFDKIKWFSLSSFFILILMVAMCKVVLYYSYDYRL